MAIMCKMCGKKPAKIHFTEIINHNVVTMDLCIECAEDKGIDVQNAGNYGLGDLVAGVFDSTVEAQTEKIGKIRCSRCGYEYSDFKKLGRFGCSDCYRAFEAQVVNLVRQIHGSTRHRGKSPKQLGPKALMRRELMELREELSRAVEKEDYERAADIRDRIKGLEEKVEGS